MSKREGKEKRKEMKGRKKEWQKAQTQVQDTADDDDKKRAREDSGSDEGADDWDELAREERMAKKLKRGDISQKDFDQQFTDL